MKFEEFGMENEKTLMLLPGTGCTWQINFGGVKEETGKEVSAMDDYHPNAIMREYYSDYVTPLENGIDVPGTRIRVIYALKMGWCI